MSGEETIIQDLTSGSIAKTLFRFSVPFVLSNLLQTIYSLVDMVVIGQWVGTNGLAAVSIGGELLSLTTFICMGFASAGQIIISQYVGSGDYRGLSKVVGNLCTVIAILAVALTALGVWNVQRLLSWLNTSESAWNQAAAYTIVCFWGTIFIYGYNVVSAILRGMGDSRHPLIFIAIASCTNLILDILFVVCLNLDTFGAALATVTGQTISFLCSVLFLLRKRGQLGFALRPDSFRLEWKYTWTILRIGCPMALNYCAIVISVLLVQSYINAYGVVASAVNGIGTKLSNVMNVVSNAIHNASSSVIGQNFSAKKYERIRRTVWLGLLFCLLIAAVLSLILCLFPTRVFSLFDQDPEVLALALTYVPIGVLGFFGHAIRAPFNGLMNGVGNARLTLCCGLLDSVVARVFLSIFMGVTLGMGIYGFWYGSMIAGYVTALIGIVYYASGFWKKRRSVIAS